MSKSLLLFYSQGVLMSLQSILFLLMSIVFLSSFTMKWKDMLLVVLLMESTSAVSLASVLYSSESVSMLLTLMPFFVGEALILLTAFYTVVRMVGSTFSNVSVS